MLDAMQIIAVVLGKNNDFIGGFYKAGAGFNENNNLISLGSHTSELSCRY